MNGVLIIDKPAGWTSHDVVNRMRRILQQRAVGHLGTLDPLATGVLPLVIGSFTRLAQFYTTSEKTYEGVIRFGFATDTYDADGTPVGEPRPVILTLQTLQELAAQFVGIIDQIPPPFSAKKIHGIPAYKLARKKKQVAFDPVQVEIKEFTITAVAGDRATFHARVASGTYMRSVAHEMGQRLGCGAHLESLRRVAVAEFDITMAHTLEGIESQAKAYYSDGFHPAEICGRISGIGGEGRDSSTRARRRSHSLRMADPEAGAPDPLADLFIHPRTLLPQFPSVTADEPTAARIRHGLSVNLPELSRARHIKVFHGQSDLIAIAARIAGTLFHPKIVFPADGWGGRSARCY
jgi:tRNA pseudouridine55 synthase